MGILAAIVMGVFVYTGARFMMPALIVGTSQGEILAVNLVPLMIAGILAIVAVSIFKI